MFYFVVSLIKWLEDLINLVKKEYRYIWYIMTFFLKMELDDFSFLILYQMNLR